MRESWFHTPAFFCINQRTFLVLPLLRRKELLFLHMVQISLVILLFSAALFYIGRLIYRNFTAKNACASGCGKCSVDFSKIEKQLQKNI
jgi:hypothetical protein